MVSRPTISPPSPASPPCSPPSPSPQVTSLRCAPCASIRSLHSTPNDLWHCSRLAITSYCHPNDFLRDADGDSGQTKQPPSRMHLPAKGWTSVCLNHP